MINLGLWDTAGQEDYERMRPLSYPDTDVFLMCFSLIGPDSFQNISQKWDPELREHCPEAPVILIGTKADYRTDDTMIDALKQKGLTIISVSEAEKKAKDIGAVRYMECSAMSQEGLELIFQAAVREGLKHQAERLGDGDKNKKTKKKKKVCLLFCCSEFNVFFSSSNRILDQTE